MSEQNKEIVRDYYARVINGRDLDAVEEFFADERMVEGVRGGCFRYFEAFPICTCRSTSSSPKATACSCARR